jgi:hypothetical protein
MKWGKGNKNEEFEWIRSNDNGMWGLYGWKIEE